MKPAPSSIAAFSGDVLTALHAADRLQAHNPVTWLYERLGGWWQEWSRRREERLQLEALALLGGHILRDLGLTDTLRTHAQAQYESQYDRLARSAAESGRAAERFGPW